MRIFRPVAYLMTLSVAQTIWRRMMWLINELERIWLEAVMARFKIIYRHLPVRAEENHGKSHPEYSTTGSGFDLRDLQLTMQECQTFGNDVQWWIYCYVTTEMW
jgi:hypothetical protein